MLTSSAMAFAMKAHEGQVRKFTREPYYYHLATVAGIVAATIPPSNPYYEEAVAVAWLHDVVEDTSTQPSELHELFGSVVSLAVLTLSEPAITPRIERRAEYTRRLAKAEWWVQTIKTADILANTESIVRNDPEFGAVYTKECLACLNAMKDAAPDLRTLALTRVASMQRALTNLDKLPLLNENTK